MATRTYSDAIDCLNSLQSNAATIEASRASGGRLAQFAQHDTQEYLGRIGYKPEDLNRLNVLHVAGTKGKGSTCAFADSILRTVKPDWTVGLYTSPHLVAVRERIRINGKPISEEDFAKYFFEVWDRLEKNTERKYESTPPKPMYFRMVTIVAFHAFLDNKVDATILEVGVGGMYDCTNIVPNPIVTGVSALGIDHTGVLGKTLREIGWQKGGIYKEGVPAFTVDQPEEGMKSLVQQAKDKKASRFTVVSRTEVLSSLRLGLAGKHQIQNANLAIHLVQEFLRATDSSVDTDILSLAFVRGLETANWPGRCQTVKDPLRENVIWFLDGAHTVESLECSMDWFFSPGVTIRNTNKPKRILVFNCTSGRNGPSFISTMLNRARAQLKKHGIEADNSEIFDHVIFCTNVTYADGGFKGDLANRVVAETLDQVLKTQKELAGAWSALVPAFPSDNIYTLPSIEHAVRVVDKLSQDGESVDVLVAGSLHLVGGMIEAAGLTEIAL